MTASPAGAAASRFLAALVGAGVRDVVVCPGARSQALALAAAALARHGAISVHVRIDERAAGFLAVGLARASDRPVAIIVTSGTAVANLHPAILEAHHADVPIIAITADRPDELRGRRANQTTEQPGIFGRSVRATFDLPAPAGVDDAALEPWVSTARAAVAAALGLGEGNDADASGGDGWQLVTEPGPVQVNLAFRAPLSDQRTVEPPMGEPIERPPIGHVEVPYAPGTVVVAGADAGPDAERLAFELGAPLIAEPSSRTRFGRHLLVDADRVLATPIADEVRRVIVFGHPTLSRSVTALIDRDDVDVLVIGRRAQDNVPGDVRIGVPQGTGAPQDARAWARDWVAADRAARPDDEGVPDTDLSRAAYARAEVAAGRRPVTRQALVDAVWQHTWPHDALVLGASRLIRVLNRHATGKPIRVHANRGLSGIDGTVSTAIGIGAVLDREARGGTTRVLLGDLTLLHDVGGLWVPADEPRPRIQFVVGNDAGGTIFDDLEVAATADPQLFDRVQLVPQAVDLAALAAAYGWDYVRVTDRSGLQRALSGGAPGIIDVQLSRHETPPDDD